MNLRCSTHRSAPALMLPDVEPSDRIGEFLALDVTDPYAFADSSFIARQLGALGSRAAVSGGSV